MSDPLEYERVLVRRMREDTHEARPRPSRTRRAIHTRDHGFGAPITRPYIEVFFIMLRQAKLPRYARAHANQSGLLMRAASGSNPASARAEKSELRREPWASEQRKLPAHWSRGPVGPAGARDREKRTGLVDRLDRFTNYE